MSSASETVRLDKWLWAARFFKTRTLANEAIAGGKVHVNGQRSKAGKEVKVGTVLTINKDGLHFEVTLTALSAQRRPAKEAVLLYEESAESVVKRDLQLAQRKLQYEFMNVTGQEHKPNKKDRRLLHRFKQQTQIE